MSTDEFDITITAASQTPGRRKNDWTAVTAPTAGDDETSGFEAGSVWFDTTGPTWYDCADPAVGLAVWVERGSPATDDQTAAEVPFTPAGSIAATDVQAAIEELDGDVGDHTTDALDAHDASAISVLDTADNFTGADVEAVLAELAGAVAALADLTDVTLTAETEGDTLRYRQGEWVNEAWPALASDDVRDAGSWEVIMVPGITGPPEPVLTMAEDDWVYGWVSS